MDKKEYTRRMRKAGYTGEIKGYICQRCDKEFFDYKFSYESEELGKYTCICGDCYNRLFWWDVRG
jgi:transposase-like protein